MNTALNTPTLCITIIGLLAALLTTRWFTVQVTKPPPQFDAGQRRQTGWFGSRMAAG